MIFPTRLRVVDGGASDLPRINARSELISFERRPKESSPPLAYRLSRTANAPIGAVDVHSLAMAMGASSVFKVSNDAGTLGLLFLIPGTEKFGFWKFPLRRLIEWQISDRSMVLYEAALLKSLELGAKSTLAFASRLPSGGLTHWFFPHAPTFRKFWSGCGVPVEAMPM